ncbi:hypothetical protein BBP40_007710 [Aspergillus hancockii]|nr:hypothetical protein BBP40_007710 [Aspergillus hancockii]
MEKMILDSTQDPTVFTEAYRSKSMNVPWETKWDSIFRNYDASVDWPAAVFWDNLVEQYPKAKVLLTVRDAEEWYASVGKTIYNWPMTEGAVWPDQMQKARAMARIVVKEGELQHYKDKEAMVEQFNQHIDHVKQVVPPVQLLVYNATQGWEPLC